ncbi:MAG: carbohydrate porin [Thiobacillus sp.]|nr:carbohydrate porin [Thiobacillus sp.]
MHMKTGHMWLRQFRSGAAAKALADSRTAVLFAGALLVVPACAMGAEAAIEAQRTSAADNGIAFGFLYRADVISNVSGGLKEGTTALGNLDVKFDFNLGALIGWDGVSVGLHGIASHGGKPNANLVGSSQGVDNIEVDTNAAKLFQAWIQKRFLNEKLSALFGLYDLNSEFYVSHSTGIFLHPSPGIGSELAQTGLNGPSVFPTSSVGLRVGYLLTPETYVQAVVLDGVPGDPDNPRGTHIQFNDGDGALRVVEAGYIPGKAKDGEQALADKYAVGAWSYTTRFADLVDVDGTGDPLMRKGNKGFYVLAERTLHRGTRNPDSHADGFIRYGRANADFNQFSSYFQTGLVLSGMVAGRGEDQFAVSYSTARTGDKHRLAASIAGAEATSHESVWEATYRARMAPWLSVQPNIQYVINPGADARIKNATVLGVRFEMSGEK